jgi:eukaryotic-like serine/threonine-protein kinase
MSVAGRPTGSDGSGSGDLPFAGYLLERRLAVGGMSEVFLARPRDEGPAAKRVVIKRLLPDLVEDDALREAFELEAKLHASIRHKNVVCFLEFGRYAGEPFIVMELIEGVDLSRIIRRSIAEERALEPGMCVYVAREICAALSCVHASHGADEDLTQIVHRDVTPTNVLISMRGEVKLADFGIARVQGRDPSLALKGKLAYLAPEQVSGDEFDHRADLFAVAVVLSEMLLGGPLFPGAGQLAVLLAIRDARIDRLRAARDQLPRGLFEVLERALARRADDRYSSALDFSLALAPFELPSRGAARAALTGWVAYAADSASAARRLEGAVLETRALTAKPRPTRESSPPSARATLPEEPVGCRLKPVGGEPREIGLPKVIEMLVTGQLGALDQVDLGDGFHPISKIAMLARYLAPNTATTKRLEGPGVPDFVGTVSVGGLNEALAWIAKRAETGVLFAEQATPEKPRAELYFETGKLVLATSSEPSTLLGEHLLSRGVIDRAELDLAVLVMHRYNGHLGDTVIALGLAEPLEVFQAIKSQGKERVAALFRWPSGTLSFYRGVEPTRNEFRLDLDVPTLMFSGLAVARSDHDIAEAWSPRMDEELAALRPLPEWARGLGWPVAMLKTLKASSGGRAVRDLIESVVRQGALAAEGRSISEGDVLRCLEIAEALGIVGPA